MIIIDKALEKRHKENNLIKVAMVGAGFMAKGIALQLISYAKGMKLVAISNRNLEKAKQAHKGSRESEPEAAAPPVAEPAPGALSAPEPATDGLSAPEPVSDTPRLVPAPHVAATESEPDAATQAPEPPVRRRASTRKVAEGAGGGAGAANGKARTGTSARAATKVGATKVGATPKAGAAPRAASRRRSTKQAD